MNYANPEMLRCWYEIYALGPQKITIDLPGTNPCKVILRAGTKIPFSRSEHELEFTIPQIRDYEVAPIA